MCGQEDSAAAVAGAPTQRQRETYLADEPFPWHLGVFDAHCHLGELVPLTVNLPTMKAHGLAVMATRTQDQELVAAIAREHSTDASNGLFKVDRATALPGFGRHPWFCHELYDDEAANPTFVPPPSLENEAALEAAKQRHYAAVLTPPPTDAEFVAQLPTPTALSVFIAETRMRLLDFPLAVVGEIGLDKAFRLPAKWPPGADRHADPARTPGGRQQRPLSPHHIAMAHQLAVFKAHLALAGALDRAVSVHGVQVHGLLYDALTACWKGHELTRAARQQASRRDGRPMVVSVADRPYPPRICLHSFGGRSDAVKQYLRPRIPAKVFYSFSRSNNMRDDSGRAKMRDAVAAIPENRLLLESDLKAAGEAIDNDLEDAARFICEIKGWSLQEGVAKLAANYLEYINA
jgi:Tat protein secretion system quality control protein TatD with DNase activity